MHHSRLCAILIDCKSSNVDEAAHGRGTPIAGIEWNADGQRRGVPT
jgi:hypothetical protein